MSRTPPVPTWWKNTYFWIAAILFVVAILGLIRGPEAIRDPGQKREDHLVVLIYFAGAVVMLVNGLLSHRQTVMHYHEVVGPPEVSTPTTMVPSVATEVKPMEPASSTTTVSRVEVGATEVEATEASEPDELDSDDIERKEV